MSAQYVHYRLKGTGRLQQQHSRVAHPLMVLGVVVAAEREPDIRFQSLREHVMIFQHGATAVHQCGEIGFTAVGTYDARSETGLASGTTCGGVSIPQGL